MLEKLGFDNGILLMRGCQRLRASNKGEGESKDTFGWLCGRIESANSEQSANQSQKNIGKEKYSNCHYQ